MKNSNVKKSIIFMFIIILVVGGIGVLSYYLFMPKEEEEFVVKNIDELKDYGIKIDEHDTELYKNEFNILKDILDEEEINYDDYALSVAKMYAIDLYTINTKVNKYDIGGIEYVHPRVKDNYTLKITNTIYKYVIDNTKGKRKQKLPEVKSVEVVDTKKDKYTIKEDKTTYDSYHIKLNITYVEDLGYDKTVEVILINDNNHIYVIESNVEKN